MTKLMMSTLQSNFFKIRIQNKQKMIYYILNINFLKQILQVKRNNSQHYNHKHLISKENDKVLRYKRYKIVRNPDLLRIEK